MGKSDEKVVPFRTVKAMSAMLSRAALAMKAGMQFGGQRDLYKVFGYKTRLTHDDFMAKYIRQDIASRIIDAPPGATWATPPTIKGNDALKVEFEKLAKKIKLWPAVYKADRLSRLGRYSGLMMGFDGGVRLENDVTASNSVRQLVYVRAMSSRHIERIALGEDPMRSTFGQPDMYTVSFGSGDDVSITDTGTIVGQTQNMKVHASRMIHIVENALEDEIIGIPIIERVYNLLDDLIKITGGAPETFWLTANRGLQADVDKDMDLQPDDAKDLEEEIEEYQHQLRRLIKTRGVKLNVLKSDTPDPSGVFNMNIALLSGTTGIPRRILLGSEAGQLASEQDRANWAERVGERRILFAEPVILNPFIDRMQGLGLLPEGEYTWEWPSAFIMSPLEQSMHMAQQARAIGNISRQTGGKVTMQLTSREEGRNIIGLEGDLKPEDIVDQALEDETPQDRNFAGGNSDNKETGRTDKDKGSSEETSED